MKSLEKTAYQNRDRTVQKGAGKKPTPVQVLNSTEARMSSIKGRMYQNMISAPADILEMKSREGLFFMSQTQREERNSITAEQKQKLKGGIDENR